MLRSISFNQTNQSNITLKSKFIFRCLSSPSVRIMIEKIMVQGLQVSTKEGKLYVKNGCGSGFSFVLWSSKRLEKENQSGLAKMRKEEEDLCFVFRILFSVNKEGDIYSKSAREREVAATQVFCERETYGCFLWAWAAYFMADMCVSLVLLFFLNLLEVFLEGHFFVL